MHKNVTSALCEVCVSVTWNVWWDTCVWCVLAAFVVCDLFGVCARTYHCSGTNFRLSVLVQRGQINRSQDSRMLTVTVLLALQPSFSRTANLGLEVVVWKLLW